MNVGVPWAIATSGMLDTARAGLSSLGVDPDRHVVVTRDRVARAKPDPDLFVAAVHELGADPLDAVVVGDSVVATLWHAARAAGRVPRALHRCRPPVRRLRP